MEELVGDIISIIQNSFIPREDKEKAVSRLDRALKTFLDAFGACNTCWGKGYIDCTDSLSIKFCLCDRGKALEGRFSPKTIGL